MKATLNFRLFSGRRSLTTTDQSKFKLRCSAETTVVHSNKPSTMRLESLMFCSIGTESPADRFPFLQAADTKVEAQPDEADQKHARHHQVIAFSRVARIDDQVAEA